MFPFQGHLREFTTSPIFCVKKTLSCDNAKFCTELISMYWTEWFHLCKRLLVLLTRCHIQFLPQQILEIVFLRIRAWWSVPPEHNQRCSILLFNFLLVRWTPDASNRAIECNAVMRCLTNCRELFSSYFRSRAKMGSNEMSSIGNICFNMCDSLLLFGKSMLSYIICHWVLFKTKENERFFDHLVSLYGNVIFWLLSTD